MPFLMANKAHETILQTLDRWIVTPNGEKLFIPAAEFAKNVDAWAGTPLVFAQDHPDPALFAQDPQAAMKAVGGKEVGTLQQPAVAMEGNPRFTGQLDWNDAQVEDLWKRHKLSASICYYSKGQDGQGRMVGPVGPNHVLLFELSEKDLPRDPGVFILNKADDKITNGEQDEAVGLLDRLKAMMMKRAPAGASSGEPAGNGKGEPEMSEEDKQKLASASKELEEFKSKLASKDAEIAELNKAKDARIAELDKQLEAFHKSAANERWAAMKTKCPPGMVHGEKEAEARKLYESDKDAFYGQLLAFKQESPGKEEGAQFMVKGEGEADVDARLAKLVPSVEIVGKG